MKLENINNTRINFFFKIQDKNNPFTKSEQNNMSSKPHNGVCGI